jgi:hypothetical protein
MDNTAAYETVTKIQAAERQLTVAIRLFFERRDPIAVHTLAAAARDILVELAKPRGVKSIFQRILPEHRRELTRAFRVAQNFFKHAGKDPDEKFPFFDDLTKFFLFDAALIDCRLTGCMLPEVAGFLGWFMKKFPHYFDTTGSPGLAAAMKLAKEQNFDDFDLVLIGIDRDAQG